MRKVSRAERILSLATTPERASVIVGDLVETGGPLWPNVIRTACSLMWRDAVRSPWRVLLTASGFFVLQFITHRFAGVAMYFAFRHYLLQPNFNRFFFKALDIGSFGVIQVVLGLGLRQYASRSGLAVFMLVAALELVYIGGVYLSLTTFSLGLILSWALLQVILWQIPILLGMLISKPTQNADRESSHRPC
jgi:hypothetical protein